MKRPDSFLTNTLSPAGRALGEAKDNPGDDSGSGMVAEIYNDPAYAAIAVIESYKDGGISDADETTTASDLRDALEEMTDKVVIDSVTPANSVDEWDSTTTYSTPGELVTWKGFQFTCFNITGNLNKDPLINPTFWYPVPKPDRLLEMAASGNAHDGGLSDIADRAGSNYRQNIAYGRYRLGGNGDDLHNFFRIHLDGTTVTGDTTLEAILKPGLAGEYFNIDMIAPEVLSSRDLLDLGDYVSTPQSSGGDADTMGALVEDQFQGWQLVTDALAYPGYSDTLATGPSAVNRPNTGAQGGNGFYPGDDGTNGTPRTGTTTHGKRFNKGASFIIVGPVSI